MNGENEEGTTANIKIRSRSSSTSSRASNSSVSETNYSVLSWLKRDGKEESKKRKKNSPEQGRETKKQSTNYKQTKMTDNKEDDIKCFNELMIYLGKKEEKDEIEKEKREIEEKERWDKLYRDNEETKNRLTRVEEKLNKELSKMKQDIEELKDGKAKTNVIVQKNEEKIEEIENKLKSLQKSLQEEIEISKKEEFRNPRTIRKNN